MRLRMLVLVLFGAVAGFYAADSLRTDRQPIPAAESGERRDEVAAAVAPRAVATERGATHEPTPLPEGLTPEESRNIEIFRGASPSVVFITTITYRRDLFTMDVFKIPRGSGSGFVWDKDGHIVTNFHVIEGGNAFSVTLADQSTWDAEVVGKAEDKDLAVLRIDAPAEKLQPLPVGGIQNLMVGQTVLAVGNPFGLDHSLTVGVVSALGRELTAPNGRTIRDIIQTDAAINPGNSGGPLLDSRGRLVGVNSAIYSPSGASVGIGFAVPVDTVKRLIPQLISHGRPIQPGIGVSLLSDSVARRFRLSGVVVYEVRPGGPADQAGVEGLTQDRAGRVVLGDRIVAVDGTSVESSDDLMHLFEQAGVEATVRLRMDRNGKERDVSLKLVAVE